MNDCLVIVTQRIGDALVTTPVIAAIAKKYGPITLVCKGSLKDLFNYNPNIAKIESYSTPSIRAKSWLQTRPRYKFAFCFTENRAFIGYAKAAASRVFSFEPSSKRNFVEGITYIPRSFSNKVHLVDESMSLIPEHIRDTNHRARLDLILTEQEKMVAINTLKPCSSDQVILAVKMRSHPDRTYRDWPVEHFLLLFKRLLARYAFLRIILLGANDETNFLNDVATNIDDPRIIPMPTKTIREAASLISASDIYLGVDTGLTHIASCFDNPIVALYHCATTSRRAGPYNHPHSTVIDLPKTGNQCQRTDGSMGEIKVQTVEAAIKGEIDKMLPIQPRT